MSLALCIAPTATAKPITLAPVGSAKVLDVDGGPAVEFTAAGAAQLSAAQLSSMRAVRIRLRVAHLSGSSPLCIRISEDLWPLCTIPADGKPHAVELRLIRPPDAAVTFGCRGDDRWRLWRAEADSFSPQKPAQLWDDGFYPKPLDASWTPPGLLDARQLVVGEARRLVLDVGPVRFLMPASVEGPRGLRNEFRAEALNSSTGQIKVTVRLEGPPQLAVPQSAVPVKAHQHLLLRPQFCSFWSGSQWAKLVFEVDGAQGAAPLRITCQPSYPAFGYFVPPDTTPPASLFTAPVSLLALPARCIDGASEVRLGPERCIYGTSENLVRLRKAEGIPGVRIACVWGPPEVWARGVEVLAAAQETLPPEKRWLLAVGPVPTILTDQGLAAAEPAVQALKKCAGRIAVVFAQSPRLPSVVPIWCKVDGRGEAVEPFWQNFTRAFDPAPLRAQLRATGANVPVAWLVPGQCTEVSVWVRAAAGLLYQGATAMLAEWSPQSTWPPPWLEAMRELSAAVPIVPLAEDDFASASPGTPVVFKPFLRGREGCVAVLNCTGREVEVAVEPRIEPIEGNMVAAAPGVPPLRTHAMPFKFQDEAFEVGRPLIIIKLRPAEVRLISLRFVGTYMEWLRSVEKMRRKVTTGPTEEAVPRYDEWWDRLRRRSHRRR